MGTSRKSCGFVYLSVPSPGELVDQHLGWLAAWVSDSKGNGRVLAWWLLDIVTKRGVSGDSFWSPRLISSLKVKKNPHIFDLHIRFTETYTFFSQYFYILIFTSINYQSYNQIFQGFCQPIWFVLLLYMLEFLAQFFVKGQIKVLTENTPECLQLSGHTNVKLFFRAIY